MLPDDLIALLARDRAQVLRMARRRLPSEADAEEVVQRALVRAVERAGSLEDPARAGVWFGRILHHAIADFYRARGRARTEDIDALDLPAAEPEPAGNACRCGMTLLDSLRPAYADVLRHVDVDGEDTDAAAAALGISTTNLHVRLHRARKALRGRVEAHCCVSSAGPCLDCTCDEHRRCGTGGAAPRSS
jgi:RNA polymerase sigma-70 factor (ECF subfamily)